jgi:hypothetical protein
MHDNMADVIDAHLAGMGEPVAEVYAGAFGIHYIGCADPNKLPVGTKLYTAPPIDLAAVREVIANHRSEAAKLSHDPESRDYLCEQADKLEAAIKGVV